MYKKQSSPLYANVSKYKNEELSAAKNEPTYYNTVTRKMPQPSQAIYSNVNYQAAQPNAIYSNVAEAGKPTYKNSQYPLYDNLKPLGLSTHQSCYSLTVKWKCYVPNGHCCFVLFALS